MFIIIYRLSLLVNKPNNSRSQQLVQLSLIKYYYFIRTQSTSNKISIFHKNQQIITSNGEEEKNDWIKRNKKCNYKYAKKRSFWRRQHIDKLISTYNTQNVWSLISSNYWQVHKELIIDDISAIVKLLLENLKNHLYIAEVQPTEITIPSCLRLHKCSRKYRLAESANWEYYRDLIYNEKKSLTYYGPWKSPFANISSPIAGNTVNKWRFAPKTHTKFTVRM